MVRGWACLTDCAVDLTISMIIIDLAYYSTGPGLSQIRAPQVTQGPGFCLAQQVPEVCARRRFPAFQMKNLLLVPWEMFL